MRRTLFQDVARRRGLSASTAAAARWISSSSSSSSFDTGVLRRRYEKLAHLQDPIQLQALRALERLRHDLVNNEPHPSKSATNTKTTATSTGWGSWMSLSSSSSTTSKQQQQSIQTQTSAAPAIRGVYLHGGVGCGKTFLMNEIFHDSLLEEEPILKGWKRRKTHFHKFMLNVHQEMHQARKKTSQQQQVLHADALISAVVDSIVGPGATNNNNNDSRPTILCFDEFQVTDVADALILQRLFTGLWHRNCVVVATSNRSPDDLYKNGLQRDRFLPFIQDLKVHCEVISMWQSENDYRLILKEMDNNNTVPQHDNNNNNNNNNPVSKGKNKLSQVYFQGGKAAYKEFDALFYQMVGASTAIAPTALAIQGRRVTIPQAALAKGIARFTFTDLCQKALGAADYLMIGQNFHTVFVQEVPEMNLPHVNWARRFITFIDAMYECHCKVILHAKTSPEQIFTPGNDEASSTTTDNIDEVFSFGRTVSRLQEMSSQVYLQTQQRSRPELESKASLLSQRKAVVTVNPSLGDS